MKLLYTAIGLVPFGAKVTGHQTLLEWRMAMSSESIDHTSMADCVRP